MRIVLSPEQKNEYLRLIGKGIKPHIASRQATSLDLMAIEAEMESDREFAAKVARILHPEKALPPPDLPDTQDIRDMARSVEAQIFRTYYELMTDDLAPPAVRKSCADALADRARGKPEQSVAQTVTVKREITDEELARRLLFNVALVQNQRELAGLPVIEGEMV